MLTLPMQTPFWGTSGVAHLCKALFWQEVASEQSCVTSFRVQVDLPPALCFT